MPTPQCVPRNRAGNEIDKRVSQPDSAGRSMFAKVDEMTLDGVYSEVSQTLVEEEGEEENRGRSLLQYC